MEYRNIFLANPARLSVQREQLVIEQAEKITVPLEDISSVLIESQQVTLSVHAAAAMADHGITVFLCDEKHLPSCQLLPINQFCRQRKLLLSQCEMGKPLQKQLWQVAGQARGEADEALAMLADEVVVHAGLIIITGQEALRAEVHQVLVAGIIFAQENKVAVFAADVALVGTIPADVGLAPDDRLDPRVLHGGIKVDHAIHHAMVSDRAARHAQPLQALYQLRYPAGPVQQAILRMQM